MRAATVRGTSHPRHGPKRFLGHTRASASGICPTGPQHDLDGDAAIAALQASPGADIIQVQRLKKRKLQLRDRITFIEDQLTPDIIA
jgi:hypothetical protein